VVCAIADAPSISPTATGRIALIIVLTPFLPFLVLVLSHSGNAKAGQAASVVTNQLNETHRYPLLS